MPVYISGFNRSPAAIRPQALPGYVKPIWSFAVGNWTLGPEYEMTSIKNRSISIKLDGPDQVSFSINGDMPEALLVTEMEDDLWTYRNGVPITRTRITESDDNISSAYEIDFKSESYAALLDRRLLRSNPFNSYFTFPGWKPVNIVEYLIRHAEAQKGMGLGLKFGQWSDLGIPAYETHLYDEDGNDMGGTTEGAYEIQNASPIFSEIQKMQKLSPTFDFWIDSELKCNVALRRGFDKGVTLDWGGVIGNVSRSFKASDFSNVIHGTMAEDAAPVWYPLGSSALGMPGNKTHFNSTDGKLTNVHGLGSMGTGVGGWATSRSFNVEVPAVLQSGTKAAYEAMNTIRYAYRATFVRGAWEGPQHVWVGDMVTLAVKRGRLNVHQALRVVGITISIDNNGVETVTVDLDIVRDELVALTRFKQLVKDLAKNKRKKK